jgi:Ion channel
MVRPQLDGTALQNQPRARLLAVIFGVFLGHLLEIGWYALAYFALHDHFGMGGFGGKVADNFATYFYFSAKSYTSIGMGDIFPLGSLRLITGVEALNGLLLVDLVHLPGDAALLERDRARLASKVRVSFV